MFEQLRERFARYVLYRHTITELNRLDHHTLRDIGFDRLSQRELRECVKENVTGICV